MMRDFVILHGLMSSSVDIWALTVTSESSTSLERCQSEQAACLGFNARIFGTYDVICMTCGFQAFRQLQRGLVLVVVCAAAFCSRAFISVQRMHGIILSSLFSYSVSHIILVPGTCISGTCT